MSNAPGTEHETRAMRNVLVTGAGGGMGRQIVAALGRRGYRVIAADVDAGAARRAAASVDEAVAVELDVSAPESWGAMVDAVGAVDHLIHCAGVILPQDGDLFTTSADTWERTFQVNALGSFLAIRSVAPLMRSGSAIVLISSIRASLGSLDGTGIAYASSKGAVTSLARSAAVSLARRGIRCNAIAPGMVETAMADVYSNDVRNRRLDRYPLGRFGTPDDVAGLAAFLLSPDASWLTGAVIPLDGAASALYA